MASNDFSAESPENYEQKCTCVLVLDVSGSMSGKPIDELNKGLQDFYNQVSHDSTTANRLEVSVITFESYVKTIIEPSLVSKFSMPKLVTGGTTKLVDGVKEGIAKIDARKNWYKKSGQPYYRPWIILITDGGPDSDQDVNYLAKEIYTSVQDKKFVFFAIGVEGADMNVLNKLSDPSMPPAMLKGLNFGAFFKWLSASMTTITSSTDGQKVSLPSPEAWMNHFTV